MKTPETPSVPWKEFWGTGYQLTEGDTLHTHTPHTPYTPETPSALCTFGGGGERWRPRRHKPRLHTSPSYTLEKATSTHTHRHTDTHRHTHTHTHNGEPLWLRRPSSEGPEDVNGPPFIYRFSRRPPPPLFLSFIRLSICVALFAWLSTSSSSFGLFRVVVLLVLRHNPLRLRLISLVYVVVSDLHSTPKKKQWNTTKGN